MKIPSITLAAFLAASGSFIFDDVSAAKPKGAKKEKKSCSSEQRQLQVLEDELQSVRTELSDEHHDLVVKLKNRPFLPTDFETELVNDGDEFETVLAVTDKHTDMHSIIMKQKHVAKMKGDGTFDLELSKTTFHNGYSAQTLEVNTTSVERRPGAEVALEAAQFAYQIIKDGAPVTNIPSIGSFSVLPDTGLNVLDFQSRNVQTPDLHFYFTNHLGYHCVAVEHLRMNFQTATSSAHPGRWIVNAYPYVGHAEAHFAFHITGSAEIRGGSDVGPDANNRLGQGQIELNFEYGSIASSIRTSILFTIRGDGWWHYEMHH